MTTLRSEKGRVLKPLRFIDLFAGIGGMRIGFQQANSATECVFSSEWDKFAKLTYEAYFGDVPHGDINEQSTFDSIPEHDVLLAGFPCQPFSLAGVTKNRALGRGHGFQHPTQGTLFFRIAQIIDHHRPAAFLLENVKHLLGHDKGNTWREIERTLIEDLGYHVDKKVIDGAVSVPQHRERIIIVGFKNAGHLENFDWPSKFRSRPGLNEILQPRADNKYVLSQHLWGYLRDYAAKHKAAGNGFGYGLVKRSKPDVITRTLSARYHKDGSEILIERRGQRPRRLTPLECSRLMGFPKGFFETVRHTNSDTQLYRQFGNSVVVPVIAAVSKSLVEALEPERQLNFSAAS